MLNAALGDRVTGTYLGHAFAGKVIDIAFPAGGGPERTYTVQTDEPINVSAFESMTIFRQRITATLDEDGDSVDTKGRRNGIMRLVGAS
jgi:hypothetical protein